jgi:hypothetical protein
MQEYIIKVYKGQCESIISQIIKNRKRPILCEHFRNYT